MLKRKGSGGRTGLLALAAFALALLVPGGVAVAHPADDSNGDGPSQDDGGSTTPRFGPDAGGGGVGQVPERPTQPAQETGGERPDSSGGSQRRAAPAPGSAVTERGAVKAPSAGADAGAGRGAGSAEASAKSSRGETSARSSRGEASAENSRASAESPRASAKSSRGDAAAASLQAAGPGKAGPKAGKRHPRAIPVANALDASALVAAAPGDGGVAPYVWIALAVLCASGLGAAGWFALARVRRRPRAPDVDDFPAVAESLRLEAELQEMLAEEALRAEERAREEQAREERLPV